MRATQAIIHLEHLKHNIEQIKGFLSSRTRLCVPVKADAYGHGAVRVAVAAIKSGATFLAVASVQEGVELREAGIVAPVLSLSLPVPEEIPSLIVHSITPLVFDEEFIRVLSAAAESMNRVIPVHLKIDTGMGRIGCRAQEAPRLASLIASLRGLFLEGVCTHFSASDSLLPQDCAYTEAQIALFDDALKKIRSQGIDPGIVHAANSGAVFLYPQAHYDMVRPGIIVYGYFPDGKPADGGIYRRIREKNGCEVTLLPVMELRTQVTVIKRVKKGAAVSYGRTWTAPCDTDIATLPVGYADGLPRLLSPGLSVCIGGRSFPVAGRICMDQCMVDLGPSHTVKRWDTAVIFGAQSGCLDAADLAANLGTISYEITCAIHKRVPRVYTGSES